MDHSGTRDVEEPLNGNEGKSGGPPDAAAHEVLQQFDLFGMPVQTAMETPAASTSEADSGASASAPARPERKRTPKTAKADTAALLFEDDVTPDSPTPEPDAPPVPTAAPKKRRGRDVVAAPPSPELL